MPISFNKIGSPWNIGFLAALIAVLLTSCSSKPALLGKWSVSLPGSITSTYQFNPDGTFAQTTQRGQISIVASGTYTVANGSVATKITVISVNGRNIAIPASFNTNHNEKFQVNGDTMKVTPESGPSFTLKRTT